MLKPLSQDWGEGKEAICGMLILLKEKVSGLWVCLLQVLSHLQKTPTCHQEAGFMVTTGDSDYSPQAFLLYQIIPGET